VIASREYKVGGGFSFTQNPKLFYAAAAAAGGAVLASVIVPRPRLHASAPAALALHVYSIFAGNK